MKTITIFLLLASLTFSGCYYDVEEQLYNCPVDPATITYSTIVNNILTSGGCTGCHGGAAPSGGISLTDYTGAKAAVTSGRIYGSINHDPGFVPMPQGGGKLSGCDIKKIKTWIDSGAPNN